MDFNSQFSIQLVVLRSSNPSLCWLRLDTAEPRPQTRSCPRRSRTLHLGSVAPRERSGSCESHGLRDARPSALECSSGSFPNRCRPSEAIAFPKVSAAHRSDLAPRSLARRGWPSSSACRPLRVACGDLIDPDPLGHEFFEVGYYLLPNRDRGRFAAFPLTLDVTIAKRFVLANHAASS